MLGCDIGGKMLVAYEAGGRGNVDNASRALDCHNWRDRFDHAPWTGEIGIEDDLPLVLVIPVGGLAGRGADARVVDKRVHPAKTSNGGFGHSGSSGHRTHIGLHGQRRYALFPAEL